jgi:hypothetical protein
MGNHLRPVSLFIYQFILDNFFCTVAYEKEMDLKLIYEEAIPYLNALILS